MKTIVHRIGFAILLSAWLPSYTQAAEKGKAPSPHDARLAQWRAARFGMFIHWGPVSLKGTEIGWSRGAEVPIAEYDNLYKRFNPVKFDADAWVKTAKDAGIKYIVLTTKHHDGFCLWDTKQTDFNIMNSPFHRDVVKELSAACKRQGILFGTYYSVTDWHHPMHPMGSPGGSTRKPTANLEGYTVYVKKQLGELIGNYGPLETIWFDVPQCFDAARGQGLIDYVRSLQPDILVNNRSGAEGDYDTPEQTVGSFQNQRPWETCMTICNQWAWKPNDPMKPLEQCLQTLVRCAGGDGNLLFNVGPTSEGLIEPRQVARLKEMGQWLEKYGESVYGTRGGPYKPNRWLASTRKGNVVYIHVLRWNAETLTLPALPKMVVKSSLLTGGTVDVTQEGQGLSIRVPARDRQKIDTIIKLELDGPAGDIPPVSLPVNSKVKATASNVYQNQTAEFGPEMAFDDDPNTRWATDAGTRQAWIAAEFARPRTLCGVRIQEEYGRRVEKFEFQCRDGGQWKTIFSGTTLGTFSKDFPPVVTRQVRLNILEANEGPTISEIELIEKK